MPELAEVEASRRFLESHCDGYEICEVATRESGGGPRDGLFDEKVFEMSDDEGNQHGEDAFRTALLNKRVQGVKRKGKQLWIELGTNNVSVLFHFGMTGSFVIENEPTPSYKSFKIQAEIWPPKFSKLVLSFRKEDNKLLRVAFTDPRRFAVSEINQIFSSSCQSLTLTFFFFTLLLIHLTAHSSSAEPLPISTNIETSPRPLSRSPAYLQ